MGRRETYGGRDGSHTQLRIGVQTRMKALALNHCSPRASAHLREGGGQGLEKHTTQEGGAQQGQGTHSLRAGGLAGTAQGPSGPALNGSRCPRQPPDRPQTHPDLTSISVGQALGSPCPPGATRPSQRPLAPVPALETPLSGTTLQGFVPHRKSRPGRPAPDSSAQGAPWGYWPQE